MGFQMEAKNALIIWERYLCQTQVLSRYPTLPHGPGGQQFLLGVGLEVRRSKLDGLNSSKSLWPCWP